ncbi:hypothetical protein TWF730_002526 [Orbilia blumenaviensis]|uniref:Uncharacterized protein n=1 Tax=Orbilia blumenaviensis TaxID=1796055 RepID=A0AAV9UEC4_9PEZI
MAEAIGLAASIVGLLAVGAKLIPWLSNVTQKMKDVPDSVRSVIFELNETTIILGAIQGYITEQEKVARNRKCLISMDNISVTLTGFVVTYSDLERYVDLAKVDDDMSTFDRSKWLLREKEVLDAVRRLQNHKSSLNLMLSIIQNSSLGKAEHEMERLCKLVEHALLRDQHLVAQLEHRNRKAIQGTSTTFSVPDTATIPSTIVEDGASTVVAAKSNSRRILLKSLLPNFEALIGERGTPFDFEKDLLTSWVYKRSGFHISKSSLWSREGSERRMALSAISQLTWAEVSNISVFSLPIFSVDIYNGYHYATLGGINIGHSISNTTQPQTPSKSTVEGPVNSVDSALAIDNRAHFKDTKPRRFTLSRSSLRVSRSTAGEIIDTTEDVDYDRKTEDQIWGTRYLGSDRRRYLVNPIKMRPRKPTAGKTARFTLISYSENPFLIPPLVTGLPEIPDESVLIGREGLLKKLTAHLDPARPRPKLLLSIDEEYQSGQFRPGAMPMEEHIPRVFFLWGRIGSGKTRIALEYLYQVRDKRGEEAGQVKSKLGFHPNHGSKGSEYQHILWVDASTHRTIRDAFYEFGRKVDSSLSSHRGEIICAALEYFNNTASPWLIIFDSLDDLDLIMNYWPLNPNGSILITTRDPELHKTIDWTVTSLGVIECKGTQIRPRHEDLRGKWAGEEVGDLDNSAAIELLINCICHPRNSLLGGGYSNSILNLCRLESYTKRKKFFEAIGASPDLIHATAEGIKLGLIDTGAILDQGYVDLRVFEEEYARYVKTNQPSVESRSQYAAITAKWDIELKNLDKFRRTTQYEPIDPENAWKDDLIPFQLLMFLHPTHFQGRVLLASYYRDNNRTQQHNEDQLLAVLSRSRRLLGGFSRPHSKFYQMSGTFRRYMAVKISWKDQQFLFGGASSILTDTLAIDHFGKCAGELSRFMVISTLVQSQHVILLDTFPHIGALRQLFSRFTPRNKIWGRSAPYIYHYTMSSGFSISFLTALRRFICIVNTTKCQDVHKAEALSCLDSLRPLFLQPDPQTYIYGSLDTTSFELAAFHIIFAGEAVGKGQLQMAMNLYREAGKYCLKINTTRASSSYGQCEASDYISTTETSSTSTNDSTTYTQWPIERMIIFNTKIARCLYASGEKLLAKTELSKEIASTRVEVSGAQEDLGEARHGVEPWKDYNCYRCGYAYLTLGLFQAQQEDLQQASHSFGSAIQHFSRWEVDRNSMRRCYVDFYLATAYALLGWLNQKLGQYKTAIGYSETAHSTYSLLLEIDKSFGLDIERKLQKLENTLYMAYHQIGESEKATHWQRTGADSMPVLPGDNLSHIIDGEDISHIIDGEDLSHIIDGEYLPHITNGEDLSHIIDGEDLSHIIDGEDLSHIIDGEDLSHIIDGEDLSHIIDGDDLSHVIDGDDLSHVIDGDDLSHVIDGDDLSHVIDGGVEAKVHEQLIWSGALDLFSKEERMLDWWLY